ncbi:MAG: branched-chain amino acid ABC transporter permease [Nitriliruptorales bacterium]
MRIVLITVVLLGVYRSLSAGFSLSIGRSLVVSGLSQGSMYALLALGFSMIYSTLRFINLAHGDFLMVGSMIGWVVAGPLVFGGWWFQAPALSLLVVLITCVVTSASVALASYRWFFRPIRTAPRMTLMVMSLGASFVIQYSTRGLLGTRFKHFPHMVELQGFWRIAGFRVFRKDVLIVVVALLLFAALYWLVTRTRTGLAIRAVADDPEAAAMMGIDVDRTSALVFALGGAAAGVGAFVWLILFPWVTFTIGIHPGFKALTAAVVGGIGSWPGAVIGGYLIGVAESVGPSLVLRGLGIPAAWQLKDVLVFGVLIVALTVRPQGLLGSRDDAV